MGYVVSGSWSPKQCQVCVSFGGVSFKSNLIVVDFSHKGYTTIQHMHSICCRHDTYVDQMVFEWVGFYVSHLVAKCFPVPNIHIIVI